MSAKNIIKIRKNLMIDQEKSHRYDEIEKLLTKAIYNNKKPDLSDKLQIIQLTSFISKIEDHIISTDEYLVNTIARLEKLEKKNKFLIYTIITVTVLLLLFR